jgi:hypothetical protein
MLVELIEKMIFYVSVLILALVVAAALGVVVCALWIPLLQLLGALAVAPSVVT